MAKTMLPRDMQLANEYTYSRKFIDRYIIQDIDNNPDMVAKVQQGIQLLDDWRNTHFTYEVGGERVAFDSKNERIAQIQDLELEPLVRQIFVGVAYCQTPELFTSVTAQLSSRLAFDDREDSIKTIAEMVAVLCQTDAFDILKPSDEASLLIQSQIPLSPELLNYVQHSDFLPPMVCEPKTVTNNFESGYLTHNECVVLGRNNGHDGDLCLDVINTQNRIPLKLDSEFLTQVAEEPTFELDTPEKFQEWTKFRDQSQQFYRLMFSQGNHFYLTNRPDKRGRQYAQGYHITPQGTAYKKAMLELAEPELVEGVPT